MGCMSSTPADATTTGERKHSRAPSFHAIGHTESQRDSASATAAAVDESPAERRRRLRAERRPSTPMGQKNGKPPLASSTTAANGNTNAAATAPATKSHGASGSNSQSRFVTSLSASRNPLTQPTDDDDGDDELASATSSTDAHALPRTEMLHEEHITTASQQQQQQRQLSSTSPSQSLSTSRRQGRHNGQGSDDNYVPYSPAAAPVKGDDGSRSMCHRHDDRRAPQQEAAEPVVESLPATPASLRYSSQHASPAPNRNLGDLPGRPQRPPPATRHASSGRSFLTVSGFFSTSDAVASITD